MAHRHLDADDNVPNANMSHHRPSRSSPLPPHRRFDGMSQPHLDASLPASCDEDACRYPSTPCATVLTRSRAAIAESWVEVSSQPSSSSLSSIGDEIVTTGLQVRRGQGQSQYGRRRLPVSRRSLPHQSAASRYAASSSQEEDYDSEDDEGGNLASSTENVSPARAPGSTDADVDDDDDDEAESESDDGDDATALGGRVDERPIFRPQPNAFTHTPHSMQRRYSTANANTDAHPHSSFTRPSFSRRSQTRVSHGGGAPNFLTPSTREDNEEALRASLTTLLSCAAAARGLPKAKDAAEAQQQRARSGLVPGNQPVDLRLMPESEMMGEQSTRATATTPAATAASPATPASTAARKRTSPTTRSPSRTRTGETKKSRRRSASASAGGRATKKKTAVGAEGAETLISPTLLTWVVSAGVVVLVSVVGFGAGYVIGREVGHQEALAASVGSGVNETTSCGREAIRGSSGTLRRFKWGAVVGKSIAA